MKSNQFKFKWKMKHFITHCFICVTQIFVLHELCYILDKNSKLHYFIGGYVIPRRTTLKIPAKLYFIIKRTKLKKLTMKKKKNIRYRKRKKKE